MSLQPGNRLGSYEILGAIGVGGMGARGRGERAERVEPPMRGGGALRHFLKLTDLAHPGVNRWR